jgi:hypothetical protein
MSVSALVSFHKSAVQNVCNDAAKNTAIKFGCHIISDMILLEFPTSPVDRVGCGAYPQKRR